MKIAVNELREKLKSKEFKVESLRVLEFEELTDGMQSCTDEVILVNASKIYKLVLSYAVYYLSECTTLRKTLKNCYDKDAMLHLEEVEPVVIPKIGRASCRERVLRLV